MRNLDLTPLYRSAIGFDRLANLVQHSEIKNNNGYPPYNIEQLDDNHYKITLAVAGFSKKQIQITAEGEKLSVIGKKEKSEQKKQYLYQGISERNFERHFQLAENIEVLDANYHDGLLTINLQRIVPEALKARTIEIIDSQIG